MEIETTNPAEIPDGVFVYVPGFGETTAGALRTQIEGLESKEDANIRYFLWKCLHSDGKQKPWKTGYITHKGQQYRSRCLMMIASSRSPKVGGSSRTSICKTLPRLGRQWIARADVLITTRSPVSVLVR